MDLAPRNAGPHEPPSLLAYDRDAYQRPAQPPHSGRHHPRPASAQDAACPAASSASRYPPSAWSKWRASCATSWASSCSPASPAWTWSTHIESIYHFRSLSQNWLLQVRVQASRRSTSRGLARQPVSVGELAGARDSTICTASSTAATPICAASCSTTTSGFPLRRDFRPTPLTVHDRATTQMDAERAVSGEQQRNVRSASSSKHLGQGDEERMHPGKPTFGSAAVYLETGQGLSPGDIGRRRDRAWLSQSTRTPTGHRQAATRIAHIHAT